MLITSDYESDLQFNRARYYDAALGKWLSEDPLGFAAGDTNLYRYVSNGPTNATDPSGESPFDDFVNGSKEELKEYGRQLEDNIKERLKGLEDDAKAEFERRLEAAKLDALIYGQKFANELLRGLLAEIDPFELGPLTISPPDITLEPDPEGKPKVRIEGDVVIPGGKGKWDFVLTPDDWLGRFEGGIQWPEGSAEGRVTIDPDGVKGKGKFEINPGFFQTVLEAVLDLMMMALGLLDLRHLGRKEMES